MEDVFSQLRTTKEGLTMEQVQERLKIFGYNKLEEKKVSALAFDKLVTGGEARPALGLNLKEPVHVTCIEDAHVRTEGLRTNTLGTKRPLSPWGLGIAFFFMGEGRNFRTASWLASSV